MPTAAASSGRSAGTDGIRQPRYGRPAGPAADGLRIWTHCFEDMLDDVFVLWDRLAPGVAGTIEPTVEQTERSAPGCRAPHPRSSKPAPARTSARCGCRSMYVMQVKSPQESKYLRDCYRVVKAMSGEEALSPITGPCPLAPKWLREDTLVPCRGARLTPAGRHGSCR